MPRIRFRIKLSFSTKLFVLMVAAICAADCSAKSAAELTIAIDLSFTIAGAPDADLIADADGIFYGTTRGGLNNQGTIYRFDPRTNVFTTLAEFHGANGAWPRASLYADASGNLYGTTYLGGANNKGVIYRLDAGTNELSTLVEFDGVSGAYPESSLIADAAGNLYGTTTTGGTQNGGTVFRLGAGTNILTTLTEYPSIGPFAANPRGGLLADAAGNFYGTTSYGGLYNNGTIFRIEAGTVITLLDIDGFNGSHPQGGLIADEAGHLYGTTLSGGGNGGGTIFRFDPTTNSLTTLAKFYDGHVTTFVSGLLADAVGNLYGIRSAGPNSRSEIFRLEAGTNTLSKLATFDANGPVGVIPQTGLIADMSGNLYGTTLFGGLTSNGTIFKLSNSGFVVPEPSIFVLLAGAGFLPCLRRQTRNTV